MNKEFFRKNKPWLISLLVVNIVLTALFFWSRGGAVTNIKIVNSAGHFQSYVDEKPIAQATFEQVSPGGIGFGFFESNFVEGIPDKQAINWVKVTDNINGTELFYDDFEGDLSKWNNIGDSWYIENNKLSNDINGPQIYSESGFWNSYTIELEVNSLRRMEIYSNVNNSQTKVVYSLVPWREQASGFYQILEGNRVEASTHIGGPVNAISSTQMIRGISRITLQSYPYAIILIMLLTGIIILVAKLSKGIKVKAPRLKLDLWQVAAYSFALLATFYFMFITTNVLDGFPHVPDAILYSFQGEIFANGRLSAPVPDGVEHFTFSPAQLSVEDNWFTQYPFGHPLALGVGHLFNAVELVPGLLAGLTLVLLFHILKELSSSRAGFLAVVIAFCSPFVQMNAINFMSHNTAMFYLALFILGFIKTTKDSTLLWPLVSGLSLGLLFNTRPLIVVPIAIIWGIAALIKILKSENLKQSLIRYLPMAFGGLIMLIAFALYNNALTGSFTTTPYALGGTATEYSLGINEVHTVGKGFLDTYTNLSLFSMVVNDWGKFSLIFIIALIATLKLKKWGILFLITAMSIPFAHFFFDGSWIMYGPRFWYELSLIIFILTVLGIEHLIELLTTKSQELFKKIYKNDIDITKLISTLVIYSLVLIVSATSLYNWLNKPEAYNETRWKGIYFQPPYLEDLEDFNFANNRLVANVQYAGISNAIVFVENTSPSWWVIGVPLFYTSPFMDSNLIFALDLGPEKNKEFLEDFPDRDVYIGNYDSGRYRKY